MSGKEVNEKGKSFYDTDLYGQGLLKYIGRYKVLKEHRIEEKIEFIKQNFPPGTCSEVKKNSKSKKVNVIAIELIVLIYMP